MLEGMPNYRSGVDGPMGHNPTKGGITFAYNDVKWYPYDHCCPREWRRGS